MTHKHRSYCDKCSSLKLVRRVSLGGGSGANFCDACLRTEVSWRKERNKSLWGKAKFRTMYKF